MQRKTSALMLVATCSSLAGGCVAPLVAGAAAGAGVFGAGEGANALARREQASDARLRHITAASVSLSSDDITSISDKDWRGGILHWVAAINDGRRFRCESGAGTAICTPLTSE